MAPPSTTTPQRQWPWKSILITLSTLTVITGIIILIIWLLVHPEKPQFTLANGSVHGVNLTHKHLWLTFNFTLKSYNPNKKISVHYEAIVANLYLSNTDPKELLASATWQTELRQPPRANSTFPDPMSIRAENVYVPHLKDPGAGDYLLGMNVTVRFKKGAWKSNHRTVMVQCVPGKSDSSNSPGLIDDCDSWSMH